MNSSEIMSMMEFLKWKEVSTKRQRKNGTQIFELPIKMGRGNSNIKVGSFKSGYVRRMNGCYTPYQLNKCKPTTEYWKSYKWVNDKQVWDGKYTKYVGKQRIVIPDEVDRLNYLISYCLKNFYIGYANQVADGKFIPKWEHEWKLKQAKDTPNDCGHYDRIQDLEEDFTNMMESRDYYQNHYEKLKEGLDKDPIENLSVTVNGARYKII